jgi:hypothetical protein
MIPLGDAQRTRREMQPPGQQERIDDESGVERFQFHRLTSSLSEGMLDPVQPPGSSHRFSAQSRRRGSPVRDD